MPTPLLPVPYAAPMLAKIRAKAAPMKPQKGVSMAALANCCTDTVTWRARTHAGDQAGAGAARWSGRTEVTIESAGGS